MPTIYIDKKPYQVRDGLNLLQACLELGFNLPFFCWHPAMGSVGACRQCAVKQFRDENDTRGRIVMACMTPAVDKTYISLTDKDAEDFRAGITELMMTNHPHDCPVCDEGGECHLQDMTVMTGHNYRRYTGKKRTFHNQNLGPFINHEMNRCIQCYRCVRFYRDFADGKDLNAFALHDHVYFGRATDGVLESEFSGNLIEVCPTGVFTDKTFKKHYVRQWDLQNAPSICVNCSVGCNIIPGERHGTLRRIRNRYNGDVNGYFLCDRGRFGYEFVNDQRRLRQPRLEDGSVPTDREALLKQLSQVFGGAPKLMGIGSPRASLESNYALRKLVGAENFYQGVSETEHGLVKQIINILQHGPARSPSLQEIAKADAVLVLGEDVLNTAPMIAYSLRQAARQKPLKLAAKLRIPEWDEYSSREVIQHDKGPLFIATPFATRMDDIATGTVRGAPEDLARLGFAVAHELDDAAPLVTGLTQEQLDQAKGIAQSLLAAERPLIVSGTSLGSQAMVQAAANVAWALCRAGHPASLSYAFAECNSLGLGLIGGESLETALQNAQSTPPDVLVILENDLFRRSEGSKVEALLNAARTVVVLDSLENPTTDRGQIVLPAATFAESNGALVNQEGRVQRFYQVFIPEGTIQDSWRWIMEILNASGRSEAANWNIIDDVQAALVDEMPVFAPLLKVAPPASFRINGAKIPRQSARYSGRTAMTANINVHERPTPSDPDTPFSFSMEGAEVVGGDKQPPSALIPRFWAPGWNSIQSTIKFQQEIAGTLRGGNPGCRLIEPASSTQTAEDSSAATSPAASQAPYASDIPAPFQPRQGEWYIIPRYHIFGSEELSILSPAIAELAPKPYLELNPEDAMAITGLSPSLASGEQSAAQDAGSGKENIPPVIELTFNGAIYRLPVRLSATLPRGIAGLPVGLPGLPTVRLPGYGHLKRTGQP